MARQLYNSIAVILVIVLFNVIIQKIDGYPHQRPDFISESKRVSRSLADKTGSGPVPSCGNRTYCLETPYYPLDYVENMVSKNESLKLLATRDVPTTISRRDDSNTEKALCTSREEVVRPKTALSIDEEWLYIVNSESYTQRVRVEICQTRNTVCSMIDGFAAGYRTTCRQTYVYRQLVAIGTTGELLPELFKLPASCKCYIKFTGHPLQRFGFNLNKLKQQSALNEIRLF